MKMQAPDNLEHIFKTRLEGYKESPDDALWGAIQKKVQKKRSRKPYVLLFALPVLLGALGLLGYQALNNQGTPAPEGADSAAVMPGATGTVSPGTANFSTDTMRAESAPANHIAALPKHITKPAQQATPGEDMLRFSASGSLMPFEYLLEKWPDHTIKEPSKAPVPLPDIVKARRAAMVKKDPKKTLTLLVYTKLGSMGSALPQNATPVQLQTKVQNLPGFGVSIGWSPARGFNILAGIEYFSANAIYSLEREGMQTVRSPIRVISPSRAVYYDTITSLQAGGTKKESFTAGHSYFSLPVSISLKMYSNVRFSAGLQGGAGYTLLRWKTRTVNNTASPQPYGPLFTTSQQYITASIGCWVSYNISSRWGAFIRPDISTLFSLNNSRKTPYNNYYYSFHTGVFINF